MDGKTEITLNLTLDETNVVLQALGSLPYAQVFSMVEKVKQQAQQQLQAATVSSVQPQ
jgi:hypothetical protein